MKLKIFLSTLIAASASSLMTSASPADGICPQILRNGVLCTDSDWADPESHFNFNKARDCELITYVVTNPQAYLALKFNDKNVAPVQKVIEKEDTASQSSLGIRILDKVNYHREGFISAGVQMNAALPLASLKNKLVMQRFQEALDKKLYIIIRDPNGQPENEMTYVDRFELGLAYPGNTCESNDVQE